MIRFSVLLSLVVSLCIVPAMLFAQVSPLTVSPTPTATPTPVPTVTATPTVVPTESPTPTATPDYQTNYGEAEVIFKMRLGKHGGNVIRFGDLTGNGQSDFLVAQNVRQSITAVSAYDLNKQLLWRIGRSKKRNFNTSYDLAIQIFDINQDGRNEVIMVRNGRLEIRAGHNGRIIRKVRVNSTAKDAVIIGKFFDRANPYGIMIKNRYKQVWVYDSDLVRYWKKTLSTGHYPFPYDFNKDGLDELVVGYTGLNSAGTELWDRNDLPAHNDGVDIFDLDQDGSPEIAIATSRQGVLLNESGETIWEKPLAHAQHAVLGHYTDDFGGGLSRVAFVDRNQNGVIASCDRNGDTLWLSTPYGFKTMISTIDGWTGVKGEGLFLVFRRASGNPIMLNADGEKVLELDFSPAFKRKNPKKHYIQHFDLTGDLREEIMIHDNRQLWIYQNKAPAPESIDIDDESLPNKRIYNASYYTGMQ